MGYGHAYLMSSKVVKFNEISLALMEKTTCFQGGESEFAHWHLLAFILGKKLSEVAYKLR